MGRGVEIEGSHRVHKEKNCEDYPVHKGKNQKTYQKSEGPVGGSKPRSQTVTFPDEKSEKFLSHDHPWKTE
jgi:hypothetical protein